jgi:hypothetical protein
MRLIVKPQDHNDKISADYRWDEFQKINIEIDYCRESSMLTISESIRPVIAIFQRFNILQAVNI